MASAFYWSGKLDRRYLRTCAVYKMLKSGRIGQSDANEIANRKIRGEPRQADYLRGTIEMWKGGPLKEMLP